MSFCPKCGNQLGQDVVFCGECGCALASYTPSNSQRIDWSKAQGQGSRGGDPDDPMLRVVKCSFKPELASKLVSLKVGGSVTLLGTVVGFTQLRQGDVGVAERVEMAPCSVRQQPPASVEPTLPTPENQ
jgi:hypothetical protein